MSTEAISKQIDGEPEWLGKLDLVRRTVAAGATPDEMELFIHQAKRSGLDPLAKQIYLVKRQGKGVVQVGIDGLRLIADRTGQYAGSDDSVFAPTNERGYPSAATVTVYKMVANQRCPFTATARWDEYFPGDAQGFQWKRMPHAMLHKCAEALALRKAFPADMSGLYVHEEMEQAGASEVVEAPKATVIPSAPSVTETQTSAVAGGTSEVVAQPVNITYDAGEFLKSIGMDGAARKSFADEFGKGWQEAALIAKQKGIETAEGLLDMYAAQLEKAHA